MMDCIKCDGDGVEAVFDDHPQAQEDGSTVVEVHEELCPRCEGTGVDPMDCRTCQHCVVDARLGSDGWYDMPSGKEEDGTRVFCRRNKYTKTGGYDVFVIPHGCIHHPCNEPQE